MAATMPPTPDGPKVQIVERVDEDKSYNYSFTYEKATLYEFKFNRAPLPDPIDPCFRCNRRVQPKDQMLVTDVLFHKQCFRCRICGLPLTQQTFHRNTDNGSSDKEVYCRTHIGKNIGQIQRGEVPAMGAEGPSVDGKKYVVQTETAFDNHLYTQEWLVKTGQIVGTSRHALPSSGAHISPVSRASPAPSLTSRATSPAPSLTNITGRSLNDTSVWTARASPNASFDMTHASALAASYSNSMKNFSHPQPTLKSYEDFENSGIFEVQPLLEQRHKEEEERLQRFLAEEREKEFKRLNDTIASEKEKAAEELLSSLDQMSLQNTVPRSLVEERERIEEHFQRVQEDRLKLVHEKISTEEKTRSGKMLDRHCQEMLMLIGEKDREMDRTNLFDHSMRPPIETPDSKKVQLYKTPAVFENIDLKAIALVNKDYENYTDLVKDLTRDCHTELEKVRAIFRWVIAKDLSKNQVSEIVRPHQTNALLKGVKSGKETYHQLFKKLCSYAGIHCEIILGYSKGAGYKPGMRMDGNAFRNSWTAVHIEGSWRLINCTWAARHVTGHRENLPQLFHKYDEFYFLTDPEDYVYQHYPDEPSWQLLEIPLPFSEFLNLPVVKSPFFNYGLRFYSNYGATLTTETGMVEIRLVTPKILGFGSLLEPVNKSASDPRQYDGRVLLRYVKNEAIFTVALPNPGLFYFTVYVGDYWNSECLESACTFLINCPAMSGRPSPPYPPVPFFGPTPVMDTLGISADTNVDPLIVCNSDYLEINFQLLKDLKISHTFQYFDVHDGAISDIDRFVFLRSRNEKGANYLVRCPKEGFYIFSLYAADPTPSGDVANNLDCAMRYLVICQEPSPSVGEFPKTCARWQRCTLHEPLAGDLLPDKRYVFKMDIPQAVEVFVVIGDIYHHLKRKIGFTWEGQVLTSSHSGTAKVIARFQVGKDQSVFSPMLEYKILEDTETEI